MLIPYLFKCGRCSTEKTYWAHIKAHNFDHVCSCGDQTQVSITTTVTIGFKILYRAGFELDKRKDYPISIIFSVMAFEAEQLSLYKKWHSLEFLEFVDPTLVDQEVREIFKRHNVKDKINETIKKLTGMPFNEYIKRDSTLLDSMRNIYPELAGDNPLASFHEILCTERNNIIHGADFAQSKEKSIEIYNLARNGIALLRSIDKDKRLIFSSKLAAKDKD